MWYPTSQMVIFYVLCYHKTINFFMTLWIFLYLLIITVWRWYCQYLWKHLRDIFTCTSWSPSHKISNLDNYIQLTAEYDNLVLDDSNQRFLLWKEADLKKCREKGIVICPADKPIYGRNFLTCESSIYFQRDEARTLCSRRILTQNLAPIFIRHSHDWIYISSSK